MSENDNKLDLIYRIERLGKDLLVQDDKINKIIGYHAPKAERFDDDYNDESFLRSGKCKLSPEEVSGFPDDIANRLRDPEVKKKLNKEQKKLKEIINELEKLLKEYRKKD